MERLRRAAGFASFLTMAACGLLISWQLRGQYSHATPPAIFISCAFSSLLSGYIGWRLAGLYKRIPRFAVFAFPVAVVFLTSAAVAIIYIVVQPLFHDWEYWAGLSSQIESIPSYMAWYAGFSSVIWIPALLITTLVLRRIARSGLRI